MKATEMLNQVKNLLGVELSDIQLAELKLENGTVLEADAFESIAEQTVYLGETGTAHSIKLAMNLQIAMLALELSEGITLTKKLREQNYKFLGLEELENGICKRCINNMSRRQLRNKKGSEMLPFYKKYTYIEYFNPT